MDPIVGSAKIAVNEWTAYYNVRNNEISLKAGTEVLITLKPTSHIATKDVKDLKVVDRKCKLKDEVEVRPR